MNFTVLRKKSESGSIRDGRHKTGTDRRRTLPSEVIGLCPESLSAVARSRKAKADRLGTTKKGINCFS
jgi:hypothetical protein